MKQILTFLTSIALLSTLAFPIASGFAQMWKMPATSGSSADRVLTPPQVKQPSDKELQDINKFFGWGNAEISNNSLIQVGTSVNQTIAASGNNTFIAWIGKSGDRNIVYLSVSHDGGRSFTPQVELTNSSTAGSASHLAACASQRITSFAWQQLNTTSGKIEVWGGESMDQGKTIYRNQLSIPSATANAHDPVIAAGNCEDVMYTMTYNNGTSMLSQWSW